MALKHILRLDIPETACESILRIVDMSTYAEPNLLPIGCERLDITLPGFNTPVYIQDLDYGFSLNLTAQDLGIVCGSEQIHYPLHDGLYTVRYSICPEDKVNVTYYHLRTTAITNQYFKELCKLHLEPCEPTVEQKQKMNDLRHLKMLIDAAKAKVEYCHAPKEGVKMLEYAKKLLTKYQTGCCITCK
jgi:hypothetical protein